MHFHLNKGKLSIFLNNEEKYKLNKEQIKMLINFLESALVQTENSKNYEGFIISPNSCMRTIQDEGVIKNENFR